MTVNQCSPNDVTLPFPRGKISLHPNLSLHPRDRPSITSIASQQKHEQQQSQA